MRTNDMIHHSVVAALVVVFLATIALAQGSAVEGWVLDRYGSPMAGCRVDLAGPAEYIGSTDEEGRFLIAGPQDGVYEIFVDCDDYTGEDIAEISPMGIEPATFIVD